MKHPLVRAKAVEIYQHISVYRDVHFESISETLVRVQEVAEESPIAEVAKELLLMWLEIHE